MGCGFKNDFIVVFCAGPYTYAYLSMFQMSAMLKKQMLTLSLNPNGRYVLVTGHLYNNPVALVNIYGSNYDN